MKFASLKNLLTQTLNALKRFPAELAYAFVACCTATIMIQNNNEDFQITSWGWRVIMACNIDLLTSLAISLYFRYRMVSRKGTASYICQVLQ